MKIDVLVVEEVLENHMNIEKSILNSIDSLVDDMVKSDADKSRIKRTLKSEREDRIKLLSEIRNELIG